MARLRPINVINILNLEEKTRVTNFFMLLVEIDARLPKTTQSKTKKRATQKIKQKPIIKRINDIKIPPNGTFYLIDIVLKPLYHVILQELLDISFNEKTLNIALYSGLC
jgi:hypothetical protein